MCCVYKRTNLYEYTCAYASNHAPQHLLVALFLEGAEDLVGVENDCVSDVERLDFPVTSSPFDLSPWLLDCPPNLEMKRVNRYKDITTYMHTTPTHARTHVRRYIPESIKKGGVASDIFIFLLCLFLDLTKLILR